MKSLRTTAQETPKATLFVIIALLIGLATMLVDSSEVLGIPTNIVKWVSFGTSALTFIVNYLQNNLNN